MSIDKNNIASNNSNITLSNNKTSSGNNSMGNTYSKKPQFWKISHGVFKNNKFKKYKKDKIVSIRKATLAKANSKTTQGEDFEKNIKKGDYFFLCRGSRIELLGKFNIDGTKTIKKIMRSGLKKLMNL